MKVIIPYVHRYRRIIFDVSVLVLAMSMVMAVREIRRGAAIASAKAQHRKIYSLVAAHIASSQRKQMVDTDVILHRFKRYIDEVYGLMEESHRDFLEILTIIGLFCLYLCYITSSSRRTKSFLDNFPYVSSCMIIAFGISLALLTLKFKCISGTIQEKGSEALTFLNQAIGVMENNAGEKYVGNEIVKDVFAWTNTVYRLIIVIDLDTMFFLMGTGVATIVSGVMLFAATCKNNCNVGISMKTKTTSAASVIIVMFLVFAWLLCRGIGGCRADNNSHSGLAAHTIPGIAKTDRFIQVLVREDTELSAAVRRDALSKLPGHLSDADLNALTGFLSAAPGRMPGVSA